jgi:hypothetical protein
MAARLETSNSEGPGVILSAQAIGGLFAGAMNPAVEFEKRQQTTGGALKTSASAVITSGCVVLWFASLGHAQQTDFAVGANAVLSSTYNSASQTFLPPAEKGGTYASVSADILFKNRVGFNGEVAFRAKQGLYNGYQGFRPVFYDFNGVLAPSLGRKVSAELMAGVGGESVLFYNRYATCNSKYYSGCLSHASSNHFMIHIGGGIRYYFWRSFFVRPEAHLYLIHNNVQFSSDYVGRVGVSIGYTLHPN